MGKGMYQDLPKGKVEGSMSEGSMHTNRGHDPAVKRLSKHPVKSLAMSGRGKKGQC